MKVQGIHHISGIVKHPQENIDFYTSLLGLRLIKKAVNFDDAYTYHFYFGNNNADIGAAITFFPWNDKAKEGKIGSGQVGVTTYAVPKGSFDFWKNRLKEFKVGFDVITRFDEEYIVFRDAHGILNELVESDQGITNEYEYNGVSSKDAIKGFATSILYSKDFNATKDFFINILGMDTFKEDNDYIRLSMDGQVVGKYVDIYKHTLDSGRNSTGTVHHIAFSVNDSDLEGFKEKIEGLGFKVSDIKNRDFFRSIYFREPGGIVIELASNAPGFNSQTLDDKALELYLPKHFEANREEIVARLTPVHVKEVSSLMEYPYNTIEEYNNYYKHQELLKKINDYVKLAKSRELTDSEKEDRQNLRRQYVSQITSSVADIANTIEIENEDGSTSKLVKKGRIQ